MRIIKMQRDIQDLNYLSAFPTIMLKHLKNYFNQLESAQITVEQEEFSLYRHGFIVLLEAGDNLLDLGKVGLNRENDGLLGSNPEYVELVELGGFQTYKVAVLLDNEYMMMFFTEVGIHDEETEQWLKEQAERY